PRARLSRYSELNKIAYDLLSLLGKYALRMKLRALDRELAVPQAHDYTLAVAVVAGGRDFQLVGKALLLDNQRMVSGGNHRRWNAAENCLAVVLHRAGLAVHQGRSANNLAT